MHYKVIIIGAGPSGTATAMTLQKNNINTCIIDKSTFPRKKLCGGLLTIRTKNIFEKIFTHKWENIVDNISTGVSLYSKYDLLNEVNNYTTIYFTRRYLFDNYLLDNVIQNNIDTYLGTSIKSLDLKSNTIILKDNTTLTYDYLVGADGVNSLVSKKLFGKSYNENEIGFTLEVELSKDKINYEINKPEIYFNIIKNGYAWVFPKKDTLTVGIGGLHCKNKSLRADFDIFLKEKFNLENVQVKGAFIPFGHFKKTPRVNNVFLCGDAAGLVDPITGEGIAYALESGFEVAQSISKNILNNTTNSEYNYKYLSSEIKIARFISFFLFNKRINTFIMNKISKSKNSIYIFLDLLSGKIKYSQLIKIIFKKLLFKTTKK